MIGRTVSVERLLEKFRGMAERESLLCGSNVSREDLLIQITGAVIATAMEEYELEQQVK